MRESELPGTGRNEGVLPATALHRHTDAFAPLSQALDGFSTFQRGLLIALVALAAFCLVINSSWTATPDSALYLALGESLARGDGYVFNGELHTFVPPGYPLLVSAAARLLGPDFLSYRILMALMGVMTAFLGYLLVLRLAGPDVAVFAGGLFVLNSTLLENSAMTLTDVPFAFFTLAALHVVLSATHAERKITWTVAAALIAGVPPLLRINGPGVPFALAFSLFCGWQGVEAKRRWLLVGLFLLVSLAPIAVWDLWKSTFPAGYGEGTYLDAVKGRSFSYQIWTIVDAFWGYFDEMNLALTGVRIKTGFLELIVPLVAFAGMVSAWRGGDRLLVPLTATQFCGLLLAPAGSRYLIFLLPALYLFLGLGILDICRWLSQRIQRPVMGSTVLRVAFVVMVVLNVGHNVRTVVQARSPQEATGAETQRSLPFFVAARWLKANDPQAQVLTTRSRMIHYLSGNRTLPLLRSGVPIAEMWVEDKAGIRDLMSRGNAEYLFSDYREAALYAKVEDALRGLGYRLEEIPEASSPPRYRLFRLIAPAEVSGP
ncbi:MAG: glycosyltransferase family 39 protein [Desulfomonile tiedjei]|nr:glycosyltransferase family 39 protein [Desulfomonile tiedjei]